MAQYDINLREYWRVIKKRKLTICLSAALLGVFSTGFAVLRAPTPLYTSQCSIKFEKETSLSGILGGALTWDTGGGIDTVMSVLKSYPVMLQVAARLGKVPSATSMESTFLRPDVAEMVSRLQAKVKVSREEFTNIINIEVTDTDPAFAQRLANAIATTYKEVHAREQTRRTTEALNYIAAQLKSVRRKLRESEEEFNRFTRENQLVSFDLQSENLLSKANEIREKIRKLREARAALNDLKVKIEQFIRNPEGRGDSFYSSFADTQYQAANAELAELLIKRDSLLKDYTEKHPEVIENARRIIEKARKMVFIVQQQIDGITRKETDLKKELADVRTKTNELMTKRLEFDRLKRKVDSYSNMTALLERKNQEALIRRADKPEEVTIVRPALLPTTPINPPRIAATGGMGVVIGLILGMVLAFIAETFDTSLGTIEDVEETLGTNVLGVIAQGDMRSLMEGLEEKDARSIQSSTFAKKICLASHFARQSVVAESFRALRTNIQFHDLEKKTKSFAVTSASPQEGKTTVAVNLAITMAQAGMKTLLIGSDMRKPAVAKAFGIESSPGLTDVLLGNYTWRDVLKTITDIIVGKMSLDEVMLTPGLDNLHIITSGTHPPNPAELIDSKRLVDLIESVKKEYDIVIFDTPPVLSTADPLILGTKVDAVILVYRVGSISKGLLKRATLQLSQVKANLMGVVLNGMRPELSPDFEDFKYYKYYYAEGQKKSRKKGRRKKGGGKKTLATPSNLVLILLSAGALTAGILWQSGIFPPGRQGKIAAVQEPAVSGKARPNQPYSLDMGTFKRLPDLLAEKKELETRGLAPYWSRIDSGTAGEKFRLLVGHFSSREAAARFRDGHGLGAARIANAPYAVRIGTFSSKEASLPTLSRLRTAGKAPYLSGDSRTGYQILIGAFETKKAAEKLARELKETGTPCDVILR